MTRKDLSPGYQAVQPAHALAQFALDHSKEFKNWQTKHKNLVVLAADDEDHLKQIYAESRVRGIKGSIMIEPDIGNELAAIALEPGEETYKLTSYLPLALKRKSSQEVVMET